MPERRQLVTNKRKQILFASVQLQEKLKLT